MKLTTTLSMCILKSRYTSYKSNRNQDSKQTY